MFIKNIGLDATQAISIVKLDAHIEKDGSNGSLLPDKVLLGPSHDLESLFRIPLCCGLSDQSVISLATPTSTVIAASRDKEIKKGIRIGVIPHPTRTGDSEIKGSQRVEIDFPLLAGELHGNPEHFLPHRLELDRHPLVEFPLAVEVGRQGKSPPVGIPCLGEKASCFGMILGQPLGSLVSCDTGRHKAQCISLARSGNLCGDTLAVERHGECLANARICEGSLGAVESEKIGPKKGGRMEIGPDFQRIQQRGRSQTLVHNEVGLPGGVEVIGDICFTNRQHLYRSQSHIRGIPIAGILFQLHRIVDSPRAEKECPVANQLSGLHPVITVFGNEIDPHGIKRGESAEIEEVRSHLAEPHHQGQIVGCCHPDF